MDVLEIAERIGHISTVPALLLGAAAAWKVAAVLTNVRDDISAIRELHGSRISKIEGKLGL